MRDFSNEISGHSKVDEEGYLLWRRRGGRGVVGF